MDNRSSLYFECHGDRVNPPLLMLHGFMGCIADWQKVIAGLIDHFYCIAVDLPGHGKSVGFAPAQKWGMAQTAAAIVQLLKQQKIPRTHLLGYSMGGRLALYLAIPFPQYFEKVLLESASPGLMSNEERQTRLQGDERIARRLESGDFQKFLLEWYEMDFFQTLRNHPDFSAMFARRRQNDPQALAKSLREMGTGQQPSLWPELPRIKFPPLLVIGEKDAKFRAIAQKMAATNPKICQSIIPGCGHNVHFEAPEIFVGEIIKWLNS